MNPYRQPSSPDMPQLAPPAAWWRVAWAQFMRCVLTRLALARRRRLDVLAQRALVAVSKVDFDARAAELRRAIALSAKVEASYVIVSARPRTTSGGPR